MKYILFIVFFSMSLLTLAQQTFELCAGESKTVVYTSESGGDGTNIWLVNGTQYISEELTYTFTNSGTYNVTIRRENGPCYVEQSLQVTITDCPRIIYWIPNTFTPDGNEFNQTFGPIMTEGIDVDGFNFTIFNRWGEIVWESNNPNGRWDGLFNGKMCVDGVYTWKLTFNVFGNDKKIVDFGHLTIIR
jgi:gliding motility-associated-like protein